MFKTLFLFCIKATSKTLKGVSSENLYTFFSVKVAFEMIALKFDWVNWNPDRVMSICDYTWLGVWTPGFALRARIAWLPCLDWLFRSDLNACISFKNVLFYRFSLVIVFLIREYLWSCRLLISSTSRCLSYLAFSSYLFLLSLASSSDFWFCGCFSLPSSCCGSYDTISI